MRSRGWLAGTLRAIDGQRYRADRDRNLRAFAHLLAGRTMPYHRAVLFLLEETAAELGLSIRSITFYRAELTRLGRLTTIEEGSTPGSRGPHHPHHGEEKNRAAVLGFVEPRRERILPPVSPSREGELLEADPYARDTGPAAPGSAPTNPRDRRGRSRRLAAALRDRVPELAGASVAGIATVLRQLVLDHWSVEDVVLAVRFRPDRQPWFRDDEPVASPRGWLTYRLRGWSFLAPPSVHQRAVDGGAADRRRAQDAADRAAARPAPEEIRAEAERIRAGRGPSFRAILARRLEEIAARRAEREKLDREKLRDWVLADAPANPWPATRTSTRDLAEARRRDRAARRDAAITAAIAALPRTRQYPGGVVDRVR